MSKSKESRVMEVYDHVIAILDIADTMDAFGAYSLIMASCHTLLQLPSDDMTAYQALEMVYNNFHKEEINNGKNN